MRLRLLALVRKRAAAFWIDCRRLNRLSPHCAVTDVVELVIALTTTTAIIQTARYSVVTFG